MSYSICINCRSMVRMFCRNAQRLHPRQWGEIMAIPDVGKGITEKDLTPPTKQ